MKPFIHPDFLLRTAAARDLYHGYAEPLPIIDFHTHLPSRDIAEDRRFENLARVWLAGDHYKWRAMRACGVDERFVTGDASDREKFDRWAAVVPRTLRNPLHHWTHLELARVFGIDDRLLDPATAPGIWDEANARLAEPGFSARGLLRRMNVDVVCTTDDPVDDLRHHAVLKVAMDFPTRVYPTFRPDRALAVEDPEAFPAYVEALARAADMDVRTGDDFVEALRRRHDHFHALGCRASDHGLEAIPAADAPASAIRAGFDKRMAGKTPSPADVRAFRGALLRELAVMDAESGWVQQYHLGALRNVNTRLARALGPDCGCDAIGDFDQVRPLARFLDALDASGRLAKTILYDLNPRDHEAFAALAGCFQDGRTPGKMQFGAAWWFLDQRDGMTRQIEALSAVGLLSLFVGMTTDSRSFLSYPRHEYFRRLLCDILGREMEGGLLPDDRDLVGGLVRDVCRLNAKRYFGFPEPADAPGSLGV